MAKGRSKRAKGTQGERIIVCLLEQHPFVAFYLQRMLRETGPDEFEILLQPTLRVQESKRSGHDLVLVIDKARLINHEAGQIHSLRALFPRATLLILGDPPATDDEVCRLLCFGIHGFITWDVVEHDFIEAARALSKGKLWISPTILDRFSRLMEHFAHSEMDSRRFTAREWAVIGLLQRRLADKEISEALHITERTVRYHLTRIFDKMGVRDRHAVVELVNTTAAGVPTVASIASA